MPHLFRPGTSGNPGGRPLSKRFRKELQKLFGENAAELAQFLADVVRGEIVAETVVSTKDGPVPVNVGPTVHEREVAAKIALEYLVGKPPTALEVSGPDGGPIAVSSACDMSKLTDAEALEFVQLADRLIDLRTRALPAAVVDAEVVSDGSEE